MRGLIQRGLVDLNRELGIAFAGAVCFHIAHSRDCDLGHCLRGVAKGP